MRTSLRRTVALLGVATIALLASIARAETPEETFDRGNAAYQRESYEDAVEAYRAVLRYGIEDPRVEYNLGNAEFKLGRLGQAILHFERARRLDPVDHDTLTNLAYARTFCFDTEIPDERALVFRWMQRTQDRAGPDRHGWLFLAICWAVAGLLAWGFSRSGRFTGAVGWSLAGLLLAGCLIGTSWWTTYQRLEGQTVAVILDEVVEVLAGPGPNNPTLFTVHEGLTVEVRGERDEWIQVSLPNGLNGWLARQSAGLI